MSGRCSAKHSSGCSTAWLGTHLSLAITGGNADEAGIETILAAPYASLAVDLIAGPDNWRLVDGHARRSRDRVRRPVGGGRYGRRSGAPAVGGRLRGVDRRPRPGPGRAGDGVVAGRPVLGGGAGQARSGSGRRSGSPALPADERRPGDRPAGRQQPERRPRPGRARAVPSTARGRTIRLDSAALRCHHPTTSPPPRWTGWRRGPGGLQGAHRGHRLRRRTAPQEVHARERTHRVRRQWDAPRTRRRAETAPRPGPARGPRPDRHARRVRHEPVRRVHRPRRRPGRQVVHDARGPGRRREHHAPSRGSPPATTSTRCRPPSGRSTASSAASARRA